MKLYLLVLFYCAILKSSFSVPLEDVAHLNDEQANLKTNLEKSTNVLDEPAKSLESENVNQFYDGNNGNYEVFFPNSLDETEKYSEKIITESSPDKKKFYSLTAKQSEYFFLSDNAGAVTIMDKTYKIVTSYELPDLSNGNAVIIENTFYHIDIVNGQVLSTNIENLMTSEGVVPWDIVGVFPSESARIRSQPVVNGSSIYFVTYSGILYAYDIISKGTTKIGITEASDSYASSVVVGKILYVHKYSRFFSFDGITLKQIQTPTTKIHCGLFQMGSHVCRVGGNTTAISPDPVSCYDPRSGKWSVDTTLDEFRRYPAITQAQSGVLVVGGEALTASWRKSCLLFNPSATYVPCPISKGPVFPQVISFLQ